MLPEGSSQRMDQASFGQRRFAPEEVEVLVREIHALRAEEQSRLPYESVRSMLIELGVEPRRLDEAIRRLDERRAAPWWRWVAAAGAAILVAATTVALGLSFLLRAPVSEAQSDSGVTLAAV